MRDRPRRQCPRLRCSRPAPCNLPGSTQAPPGRRARRGSGGHQARYLDEPVGFRELQRAAENVSLTTADRANLDLEPGGEEVGQGVHRLMRVFRLEFSQWVMIIIDKYLKIIPRS